VLWSVRRSSAPVSSIRSHAGLSAVCLAFSAIRVPTLRHASVLIMGPVKMFPIGRCPGAKTSALISARETVLACLSEVVSWPACASSSSQIMSSSSGRISLARQAT
jgi:hypothetical protein